MRCPACTAENAEPARFCAGCGSPPGAWPAERLWLLRAFIPADLTVTDRHG